MADRFEAVLRTPFGGPWRHLTSPVRVVSTHAVVGVRTALAEVEAAVHSGLYAAGFVTYEASAAFGLPATVQHGPRCNMEQNGLPLVCFGLFDAESIETLAQLPQGGAAELGEWQPSIAHAAYLRAITAIKARIEAGDTYQINFTFRLNAPFRGEPAALMRDLYAAQAGRWSAFVDIGTHAICSASPELFVLGEDGRLECHPMKGTAARGWWPAQDAQRGKQLQLSEKNRAENVMIVDMVRNDLGRIATVGSVRAVSLFDVERYPLQWQMTSRVVAEAPGAGLSAIFESMFPSGSITGAPKHSAMSIIGELESTPRGIYTGAIGYLSPHGRWHFNVAIRTVLIDRTLNTAEFGVGSGIVWDSVDRDEYDECLIKARMVHVQSSAFGAQPSAVPIPSYIAGDAPDFRLLETLRWTHESGLVLLERHLARMHASAECFGFIHGVQELRALLNEATADLVNPARVRLLLEHDGTVVCEAADLEPLPERSLRAALAADPVDPHDVVLFHKTTRRTTYERARASRPDAEAVILWNTLGEVTEGTDFNLVVEIDGARVTPPVECGLLPGTFRAQLLDDGEISERRITVDELCAAGRGWLINSVRGWVPFTL
ncbi:MAG: aminodeoxychorismate synthase component I [Acidobacteria bacterium]|nr:aminodeoxychorismate synthase component I [Acidobacteriota bacterium]